jgi:hypothetical protein
MIECVHVASHAIKPPSLGTGLWDLVKFESWIRALGDADRVATGFVVKSQRVKDSILPSVLDKSKQDCPGAWRAAGARVDCLKRLVGSTSGRRMEHEWDHLEH